MFLTHVQEKEATIVRGREGNDDLWGRRVKQDRDAQLRELLAQPSHGNSGEGTARGQVPFTAWVEGADSITRHTPRVCRILRHILFHACQAWLVLITSGPTQVRLISGSTISNRKKTNVVKANMIKKVLKAAVQALKGCLEFRDDSVPRPLHQGSSPKNLLQKACCSPAAEKRIPGPSASLQRGPRERWPWPPPSLPSWC